MILVLMEVKIEVLEEIAYLTLSGYSIQYVCNADIYISTDVLDI